MRNISLKNKEKLRYVKIITKIYKHLNYKHISKHTKHIDIKMH